MKITHRTIEIIQTIIENNANNIEMNRKIHGKSYKKLLTINRKTIEIIEKQLKIVQTYREIIETTMEHNRTNYGT